MTRIEHLEWCKQRAREYLVVGDERQAVTSMVSDLNKHGETRIDPAGALGALALGAMIGTIDARAFIEGFN